MTGKICLITGANAGIGYAISLGLAKMGANVVMVCRDKSRGKIALAELKEKSNNSSISLYIADLSSQSSIRQLVTDFKKDFGQLDILINNAGVITPIRTLTTDGLETQFALNHLAPFLLTELLLDSLKSSDSARIINISSNAHQIANINFDDLQSEQEYKPKEVYQRTKLCNILFTYELARQLEGTHITANCVHPGVITTKLLQAYNGGNGGFSFISKLLYGTPQKGAETPLYLASSSEVEGISGKYFANKKIAQSSNYANDLSVAKRLWQISKSLTKHKQVTVE
ncbi:MAG: NAD(P)-dependent dehydrogenase (short-subunit alcohol dehydrogenase family) [Psychroserpens sp.]|jgi:NAD(P)-dependent dehydrogenase (short-subunit alcohol dehydrogenase family)